MYIETMFSLLEKYTHKGNFYCSAENAYKESCNAPNDKAGIYLIFKIEGDKETLLYIGSSGRKTDSGELKIRKGGLRDRLINGYHPNRFGQDKRLKRHIALPLQMVAEGISAIRIEWWITYDDNNGDFPTDVEARLLQQYRETHGGQLPPWHQ